MCQANLHNANRFTKTCWPCDILNNVCFCVWTLAWRLSTSFGDACHFRYIANTTHRNLQTLKVSMITFLENREYKTKSYRADMSRQATTQGLFIADTMRCLHMGQRRVGLLSLSIPVASGSHNRSKIGSRSSASRPQ